MDYFDRLASMPLESCRRRQRTGPLPTGWRRATGPLHMSAWLLWPSRYFRLLTLNKDRRAGLIARRRRKPLHRARKQRFAAVLVYSRQEGVGEASRSRNLGDPLRCLDRRRAAG